MHQMKERVCITVDPDLIKKAKECKINVSNVAEAALMRELEVFTRSFYAKAMENKVNLLMQFLTDRNLIEDFESYKYDV